MNDVICGLFIDALYLVEEDPFYSSSVEFIFTKGCWLLSNASLPSLRLWDAHEVPHLLRSVHVVYYVNWFSYVKPTLHSSDFLLEDNGVCMFLLCVHVHVKGSVAWLEAKEFGGTCNEFITYGCRVGCQCGSGGWYGWGRGRQQQDTEDLVCYAQVLEYLVGCCEPTVVVELSSEMTWSDSRKIILAALYRTE